MTTSQILTADGRGRLSLGSKHANALFRATERDDGSVVLERGDFIPHQTVASRSWTAGPVGRYTILGSSQSIALADKGIYEGHRGWNFQDGNIVLSGLHARTREALLNLIVGRAVLDPEKFAAHIYDPHGTLEWADEYHGVHARCGDSGKFLSHVNKDLVPTMRRNRDATEHAAQKGLPESRILHHLIIVSDADELASREGTEAVATADRICDEGPVDGVSTVAVVNDTERFADEFTSEISDSFTVFTQGSDGSDESAIRSNRHGEWTILDGLSIPSLVRDSNAVRRI